MEAARFPNLNVALQLCDTFELFGKPEHCAERTMRVREEAGIEHVFLFPAHDMKTGYDLPHAEVDFREPKVQNPCRVEPPKHNRVDEQARTPVARILSAKVLTSRRLPIADQEQFNGF